MYQERWGWGSIIISVFCKACSGCSVEDTSVSSSKRSRWEYVEGFKGYWKVKSAGPGDGLSMGCGGKTFWECPPAPRLTGLSRFQAVSCSAVSIYVDDPVCKKSQEFFKMLNLKYMYNICKVSSGQLNNKRLKNSVSVGPETEFCGLAVRRGEAVFESEKSRASRIDLWELQNLMAE